MQFSTIMSVIKTMANISSTKKDVPIKIAIQTGLDLATSTILPYLQTPAAIRLIPLEETGTVTVTNGNKTVTGSGTAFTAAMVGRKIRLEGENQFYRITAVGSTTSLTLDIEYAEDSDSGLSYSIFKDEYRLAADADSYKILRQLKNKRPLIGVTGAAFDLFEPSPTSEGDPSFSIFRGTKLDTYTTGTVTASANTSTITGSSTVWTSVEGLGRGTRITIGTNVFTIKSVDSDTQVTIYEDIISDFAGSTYSVLMDNLIVQVFQIPDDEQIVRYYYQRTAYPLFNDQDIPDLPDKWHQILITAGLIAAWTAKDKDEAIRQTQILSAQIAQMIREVGYPDTSTIIPKKIQDRFFLGNLTNPLMESNVGVPQSIARSSL